MGWGDGGFPVLAALGDEEEHTKPRDALVIQDVGDSDDAVGVDLELGFLGGVEGLLLVYLHVYHELAVGTGSLDEVAVVPGVPRGG